MLYGATLFDIFAVLRLCHAAIRYTRHAYICRLLRARYDALLLLYYTLCVIFAFHYAAALFFRHTIQHTTSECNSNVAYKEYAA